MSTNLPLRAQRRSRRPRIVISSVSVLLALTGTAQTAPASADTVTVLLGPGDSGAAVVALQQYLGEPTTGTYTASTGDAVSEWQADHDLAETGLVTADMWPAVTRAVEDAPAAPAPAAPAPAPAAPAPSAPAPAAPAPAAPTPAAPAPAAPTPAAPAPAAPTPTASTPAPTVQPGSGGAFVNAAGDTGAETGALRRVKPNAGNVGAGVVAPRPTELADSGDGTWIGGTLHITKDLRNKVVNGFVQIDGDNITVENNIIRGNSRHAPGGDEFMVDTGGGHTGTVVRFNDIANTYASPHVNGIGPRNVVAEFNDISRVTDAFKPSPRGSNDVRTVIRGNYVHDFAFYGNDWSHRPTPLWSAGGVLVTGPWAGKPWNHADAVQVEVDGTTGLDIYGNTFDAQWANDGTSTLPLPNVVKELSVFMLNAGENLRVEDNWIDGGEYAVNNASSSVSGSFARNRFGRSMGHRNGTDDGDYFALMIASGSIATHDGTSNQNVWEDTGRRVPRRDN